MSCANRILLVLAALAPAFISAWGQSGGRTIPMAENLPPGEASTAGMSLANLEQIALERNPTLVQAGAQVRISRGKSLQAGLYPNPSIGYVAEQIGADGTAGELHGMFVEQQIITGGKLQLSRAKFAQEAQQAELQVLAQRYRVLHSVRLAYYETLAHARRLELRRQLLQNAAELNETVAELVNTGQANRADLLQAQIEWERSKAYLRMAESRYEAVWRELAAVIGMPDLQPVSLEGELEFDGREVIDRETALAELFASSPQLGVAQAEVERDRIALQRERVEPIPNLSLRAETGYNFDAEDAVAGVEIGVRVPLFDRNQGTILQAQAELARAQAELGRLELMLRQRFARAYADLESAVALANTYRSETLPRAEEILRLYRESFQERRAAWPQVLDAQREYFQLYEEYLDHVIDARRAETQIATFFLEDGLSQPPEPTPAGHRDATPRPR